MIALIKIQRTNTLEDIENSPLLNKLTWDVQHESVNEHINLSYHLVDISREVIIEMNRHRIGIGTSQRSTRYTLDTLVNRWCALRDNHTPETHDLYHLAIAKNIVDLDETMVAITADYIFRKLFVYNEEQPLIKGLTGSKKKKQNDRVKRCLPEVWLMEGIWTFNLRALKHFIDLRKGANAYYGIREVVEAIIEATPQKYLDLCLKPKVK